MFRRWVLFCFSAVSRDLLPVPVPGFFLPEVSFSLVVMDVDFLYQQLGAFS